MQYASSFNSNVQHSRGYSTMVCRSLNSLSLFSGPGGVTGKMKHTSQTPWANRLVSLAASERLCCFCASVLRG